MSLPKKTFWTTAVLSLLAIPMLVSSVTLAAEPGKKANRFALPEGGPKVLAKFIEDLRKGAPKPPSKTATPQEQRKQEAAYMRYTIRSNMAIEDASEKILEIEKDKTSHAYHVAYAIVIQKYPRRIYDASPQEQAKLFEEVKQYILAEKKVPLANIRLMLETATALERGGNTKLAITAYELAGKAAAKSDSMHAASLVEHCKTCISKLRLPGSQLTVLTGTTLDGKEFDWKTFSKGKVVLIDFWATWCPPCCREIPHVAKKYKEYHARGFEVVGISLDHSGKPLRKYVEKHKIPWTTLFDEDPEKRQAMANRYGAFAIPMLILVDRTGKIVSINARGEELDRLLKELFDTPKAKK